MNFRRDLLVLSLIWRQLLNGLRETRASALSQLLALGGFFLAYLIADIAVALRKTAPNSA